MKTELMYNQNSYKCYLDYVKTYIELDGKKSRRHSNV